MYPSPHYQELDRKKLISVIQKFPLGMLVTVYDNKPLITHIPFIYNTETKTLVAHIDKNNPQYNTLQEGTEATVIFKGPDCYISPSIYESKDQLPTWNYIAVHITGKIHLINDAEIAKNSMIAMTKFLEGSEQRFVLQKDNPKMDRFVNYIQTFEIEITKWEGKFKLSQDKSKADQENTRSALKAKTERSLSEFINSIYRN
ncbi:FMN-binding negative transcriptional regulator [Marixanthomonas sp. SCSIO 43207]|uniref:FMN-binding negative transcriptional regulator n=1 Tax=Marixanthomonas sp. SCSIO 43207 TaxID=2779360 RepID=UPI001CA82B46|nr:FMN-binding negative transcriptional regulator [Marixanthomonas sp. SCSIO 43207]UAB79904.1 FMN-binding negative transcriptional regulator [Marixanthomonas sp. SCSIO 43207]